MSLPPNADPPRLHATALAKPRSTLDATLGKTGTIRKTTVPSRPTSTIRDTQLCTPNVSVMNSAKQRPSEPNVKQIFEMASQAKIPRGNPYVLDPEYVDIECEIRGIPGADVGQLAQMMLEEEAKTRARPTNMHAIESTHSEMVNCQAMINVLLEDAAALPHESNMERYHQLLARSAHLGRRLERLVNTCPPHPDLTRLIERMTRTINTISVIQKHIVGTTSDQEGAVGGQSTSTVDPDGEVERMFQRRSSQPYPQNSNALDGAAGDDNEVNRERQHPKTATHNQRRSYRDRSVSVEPETQKTTHPGRTRAAVQERDECEHRRERRQRLNSGEGRTYREKRELPRRQRQRSTSNERDDVKASRRRRTNTERRSDQQRTRQDRYSSNERRVSDDQRSDRRRRGDRDYRRRQRSSTSESSGNNRRRPERVRPRNRYSSADSRDSNSSEWDERRHDRDRQRRGRGRNSACKVMSDWRVRFSGDRKDPPVEDVLFRLEHLARSNQIRRDDLVDGLHNVLTGEAGEWFWHYLRKHETPGWERVKRALTQRFVTRGSDDEIRSMMALRVQRRGEKFDDFCREVERLSFQLRTPIREHKLLELLMRNAEEQMRQVLCLHEIDTIEQMRSTCQRYERLWSSRDRLHRTQRNVDEIEELAEEFGRVVNTMPMQRRPPSSGGAETTYQDYDDQEWNEQESIAALQPDRAAEMICWNCDEKGHTYAECEVATRNVFCYGCGAKNIYMPTCPRCAGNVKRRGLIGPSRSINPFGPKTSDRTTQARQKK